MNPKISVLIITYKQEELVKRAIDSLLPQREYIYEICISDDNSPDNTWNVLTEYDRMYPGLFKLHQNNPNIGIFENIEQVWTMASGDMVYMLAGDDAVPGDYFKTIYEFVNNKNLNSSVPFCIYTDFTEVFPNGTSINHSNKMINKSNSLKLKIRQLISNRGCCYSKSVLDSFVKVSNGRSYTVELAQDAQLQMFSEENYYINVPGNIYFSQVGVSVSMSSVERQQSFIESFPFAAMFFKEQGFTLDSYDKNFIRFVHAFESYRFKHKLSNLFLAVFYYILSIDVRLGASGFQIERIERLLRKKVGCV